MKSKKLIIPSSPKPQDTFDLSISTCEKLFDIYEQVCNNLDSEQMFSFDFSSCRFLQPYAVVIIGGLLRLIKRNGLKAEFRNFSNPAVKEYLEANGFLQKFQKSSKPTKLTAVPYEEFHVLDPDIINEVIQTFGKGNSAS
jgi:hypothetical protein